MLFSAGNLAVAAVASKNPTDIGLNCVHLDPDGTSVATDGKMLMAVGPVDASKFHFPDVGEQTTPPSPRGVSVPLDLIDKAAKNMPRDKRPALRHVALVKARDNKKIELATTDMRHEQKVAGLPKNEPFPDWRALIRTVRGSGGSRICVNRKALVELLRALENACPDRGDENPVFVEINPEGTGLVMRCFNRETGQRAIAASKAYNTKGQWLQQDSWEQGVFQTEVKKPLIRKIQ
jgi:hypothetical protein